jgi:hypothetical protein
MFLADKAEAEIELMPLTKEIADQLWKTSRHKNTAADIGHIRVLQRSPLEDALHFLRRRRTSAQTSTANSDVERRKRHRDESSEEVGDKKETEADTEVEEKRTATWQARPIPEFRPRQPQGPRQI